MRNLRGWVAGSHPWAAANHPWLAGNHPGVGQGWLEFILEDILGWLDVTLRWLEVILGVGLGWMEVKFIVLGFLLTTQGDKPHQ